jgi:hypothetical protein
MIRVGLVVLVVSWIAVAVTAGESALRYHPTVPLDPRVYQHPTPWETPGDCRPISSTIDPCGGR